MPDAIEFLPDWLQREGYETVMATRGQQALALAEEVRPDVILLDVMMPGMDGIETCRRLHMNPATANIPVILMSARSPAEARAEGLQAGATDYVTKPIHFEDLLERLERIVRLQADTQQPDHSRLLEEMAYTALAVLPCHLAWLLVVDSDNRWIAHRAIALDRGADAARHFLSLVSREGADVRFPLQHGDNPLAEVILNRTVLINVPAAELDRMPGGTLFQLACAQYRLGYVSALPLITSGRAVGVMVLGMVDERTGESQRAQQILNSLSIQAAMVVDNARLLTDLAAQQEQMRAEQAFRQMVLDTMGEGLIVVDEEAKVSYVNNRLLRMTDYTREMLYGRSVGLLFHPSQREQLVRSLTGDRRSTLPFSQRLFTRHDRSIPVLLSRAVVHSGDERDQGTVMVVTDLSELQRNEEALKRQTDRLQALNRSTNAISSARSVHEVVSITLESALRVVQGEGVSILLRDREDAHLLVTAATMGSHVGDLAVRVGEGLVGWVAASSRAQLVVKLSDDEEIREQQIGLFGENMQSAIIVPLVASDETIGVLYVVNKRQGTFDEQDLEALQSLAGSAAVAIESARLFEQSRRRVAELSTLLDASAAASSTLDFGDILERIARRLSLSLQVERVVITNWHRNARRLFTMAEVVNAYWAPGTGPVRSLRAMPLTRSALEGGVVALAGDVEQREMTPSGLYTLAAFPLTIGAVTVGAVTVHRETLAEPLGATYVEAVQDIVGRWQAAVEGHDAQAWVSRSNLTDLCQRVLQGSGVRWCAVVYWDAGQQEARLLREIGRGLWLDQSGSLWDLDRQFTSLARVLESGVAETLQLSLLDDDPAEQAFLRDVGGSTCLVAPLFIRGESSGLVKLVDSRREQRVFDDDEVSLCQGIANVVANALENAQLYAEQERRASALADAYRELKAADQIKDDLLQNLSHELRTPLTHILGYLRLLADEAFGALNREQTEAVNLVVSKAQHLTDLVKNIVTVQEADAHNLDLKPIQLERVLALAIRSMAGKAEARQIRIKPHIPSSLPPAHADPVRVGEVFEELLENAIKFSPNGTQVEVTIDDPGGPLLHACVRDYGIGIPLEEQEKIFQRFYQVDSGTTRRFGGTGLGLAIVRQVVEGHHGRVWVESEPGQGSCFHLTLPKTTAYQD